MSDSASHTFLFADLAGYTALTEAHGDERAAEIVGDFCANVRSLLVDHGAEQIKTIGDEVMARVDEPEEAVNLGLRIVAELAAHGAPPIRVGMHTGPAIERDGDWFGASVNLAARVAGVAKAGEVLLTRGTMEALSDDAGEDFRPRGPRWFKNVPEPIEIFAAEAPGANVEFAIDPVCRMAVDPARSAANASYRGRRYEFCSSGCRTAFQADERRYIAKSPRARAARRAFLTHLRIFALAQGAFAAIWLLSAFAVGEFAFPWFAFVFVGWGIPLLMHYRAVRSVL